MSEIILVVEDDKNISDLLEIYLKNEGYDVITTCSTEEAMESCIKKKFDLAIIDVMLPGKDGFYLCSELRKHHNFPIIMLTAKSDESSKITGLTMGADDYITKPFLPLEVMARVKAQIRRYKKYNFQEEKAEETLLTYVGIELNVKSRECFVNKKLVSLTPSEFAILRVLLEKQGEVIESEKLLQLVWNNEYYAKNNNTITVHIRHLREKLGDKTQKPKYIKTVWGWDIKLAEKVKKRLKVHLILTLIAYSFTGWIILIFIDFYGSKSSSVLLKNALLRIDIIGILYIIIGYIIIFLWYWNKMCGYLDQIVSGIETIYKQDDTLIALPEPLNEVEGFMNRIKMSVMIANKAAKAEENKKNEIVAYLAHDIRTPLTSIIGYLNLLDEIPDMDETKRMEYIHRVLDRAEHLEDLVNEFFEITQYNTGEVIANKTKIDIHYMFLQLQDEFLPMLEENKNELILDMKGKIIANVDAEKLSRAFSNLLKNAILYSFPKTAICISANISDNNLYIKMKNKGKTIAKEDLGKIFGKFNRLDGARQSNNIGAGLGLSITKEIINLHGGNITAESSNNEVVFHVKIPLE